MDWTSQQSRTSCLVTKAVVCQDETQSRWRKTPDTVMVWSAFSGKMERSGLYFLPKNVTMKSSFKVVES
ncbi:hypothetical protein E2C01_026531 [Portunus trituberculatus]|uniref:Uncharacterized protein n=1 Tax=Portunus trituberculatus TaxID=210409 RepID=A0A5B7EIJ7_PORTR|nr:hypothetical protein [Portunus trituberculatus]